MWGKMVGKKKGKGNGERIVENCSTQNLQSREKSYSDSDSEVLRLVQTSSTPTIDEVTLE